MMKRIPASKICYSSIKRDKRTVKYIVIHYTAVKGDTAVNEGKYFSHSTRTAGAHFFIDRKGVVVKSINLDRTAWAVGGRKYSDCGKTGGGKYYGKCTNANSVSIELCDIVDQDPSKAQKQAVYNTIRYIKKHCPNAQTIIRHFDVNGKHCPARFMNENKWKRLWIEIA